MFSAAFAMLSISLLGIFLLILESFVNLRELSGIDKPAFQGSCRHKLPCYFNITPQLCCTIQSDTVHSFRYSTSFTWQLNLPFVHFILGSSFVVFIFVSDTLGSGQFSHGEVSCLYDKKGKFLAF